MGNSKRIIKQSIAITCCLLLVIGAGRAMAGEKEERNDERHVYVKEYDNTARADIKVGETVRTDAGMGRQDVPSIEADDREEVSESEPEDTEAESASDGSGRDSDPTEAGDNDIEVDYAESADDTVSDMESTDSTGWDWGMENDSSVSEYWDGDTVSEYDGYYDSGVDESGYADTAGEYGSEYESTVSELVESEPVEGEPEWDGGSAETEPMGEMTYLGVWQSTGYCPCELCCGVWATGCTASGTLATEGRTVACGSLPMGTVIYIEGFGYRTVEDLGVEGEWVDIFYSSHEAASAHGLQNVNVYLVN